MHMSADFFGDVSIENLCCQSGKLRLVSSGHRSDSKAEFQYPGAPRNTLYHEAVYNVGIGQRLNLGRVKLMSTFACKIPAGGSRRQLVVVRLSLSCVE